MRSAPRWKTPWSIAEDRILNPEGLRFPDEFVRHKVLDAIGDLALAGAPILGAYRSVRGGHKLNHAVLAALLSDPTAWAVVEDRTPARQPHAAVEVGVTVRGRVGLLNPPDAGLTLTP